MKNAILALAILFLAACQSDPQPRIWGAELNAYMEARGYTLAEDKQTILKNGYPVWQDKPCLARMCLGNNTSLVPSELAEGVRVDLLDALADAREAHIKEIGKQIGVEPFKKTIDSN